MPTPTDMLHAARSILLAFLLSVSATPAVAQAPEGPPPPPDGLRVFLDCQRCDFDFIREQVPVIDYVRDPAVADLHVLVTNQQTGAGGEEYVFQFLGRNQLAGLADTLRYVTLQTDSDDEVRRGYAQTFGAGLVRYLAYAAQTDRIELGFREVTGPTRQTVPEDDPWNLWVFRANMSGELEGESLQRSRALNGGLSASRTTEDFKIDVGFRGEYEWEEFDNVDEDDGSVESFTSSATEIDVSSTAVWSIGPHWSWGLSAESGSDSPSNQRFYLRGGPALEYSLYPYAEANNRQITALYRIGAATFQYQDTTVFGQLAETRPEHSLEISADFRQPWGEFVLSLEGSHFLDDVTQHRVDVFTNLEIRLFRGFNLDIRGNVARVKDQIYLSVTEVDLEDRLLGRAEIGTDFEYSVDVGFSFTFGSVFNNVVNPRIRTGGRRFF
ncbi:MAG: hypothetical protein WEA34_08415 [Gemmatimonadota bacterium]